MKAKQIKIILTSFTALAFIFFPEVGLYAQVVDDTEKTKEVVVIEKVEDPLVDSEQEGSEQESEEEVETEEFDEEVEDVSLDIDEEIVDDIQSDTEQDEEILEDWSEDLETPVPELPDGQHGTGQAEEILEDENLDSEDTENIESDPEEEVVSDTLAEESEETPVPELPDGQHGTGQAEGNSVVIDETVEESDTENLDTEKEEIEQGENEIKEESASGDSKDEETKDPSTSSEQDEEVKDEIVKSEETKEEMVDERVPEGVEEEIAEEVLEEELLIPEVNIIYQYDIPVLDSESLLSIVYATGLTDKYQGFGEEWGITVSEDLKSKVTEINHNGQTFISSIDTGDTSVVFGYNSNSTINSISFRSAGLEVQNISFKYNGGELSGLVQKTEFSQHKVKFQYDGFENKDTDSESVSIIKKLSKVFEPFMAEKEIEY